MLARRWRPQAARCDGAMVTWCDWLVMRALDNEGAPRRRLGATRKASWKRDVAATI